MKTATIRLLVLNTIVAVVSSAQEYRGRVQGVVTDATDAAVSGAAVRLQNVDTGIATVKPTDNYGHYLFDLVVPGAYKLIAEAAGFNRYELEYLLEQDL